MTVLLILVIAGGFGFGYTVGKFQGRWRNLLRRQPAPPVAPKAFHPDGQGGFRSNDH